MTVPMYIAESAPPEMRGRLVTLNNVFITGGQLIASILDGAFSYDTEDGWRLVWGRKDQDELNTLRPRQDGRHFPMHFLEWKSMHFDGNFIEVCS